MHEETISPVDAVSRADFPSDIFNPGGGAVNWLLSDNVRGWLEERCGETDCTLESENVVRYCVDRSSKHHEKRHSKRHEDSFPRCVVSAFDSFFPSSKPATPLRDSSFEIQREIKNTATLERQTLTAARVCNGGLVTLSNFKRYHGGRGEYYLHKYCSSYEILVECLPEWYRERVEERERFL